MTLKASSLPYLVWLFDVVLALLSTGSTPTPYPNSSNPGHTVLEPIQYWKATASSPFLTFLTFLHILWYRWDGQDFVKHVPTYVAYVLGPVGLMHWIVQDGYYDSSQATIIMCTEGFAKSHTERLIVVLHKRFGIVATLKRSSRANGTYRIRFSCRSMPLVHSLVGGLMPSQYHYKLGPGYKHLTLYPPIPPTTLS